MDALNAKLKESEYVAKFHGDDLLADKQTVMTGLWDDLRSVFTQKNASSIGTVAWDKLTGKEVEVSFKRAITRMFLLNFFVHIESRHCITCRFNAHK